MSEEIKTVEENGQTPAQQEPEITREYLRELRVQGKHEETKNAIEKLNNSNVATTTVEDQHQEQHQEPDVNEEGKKFVIDYRGNKVEFDDSDNYLGYGNFGRLKKSFAHQKETIKDYEKRLRETNDYSEREIAKLKKDREELLEKFNQIKAQNELPKKEVKEPVETNIPTPPVRPKLPSDFYDWNEEDHKNYNEWLEKRDEYDVKMSEIIKGVATRKPESNPYDSEDVKKLKEHIRKIEEDNSRREIEDTQKKYWTSISDFQGNHSEFKTSKPIKDVHSDIMKWMDELSYQNGVSLKPGASDFDKRNYESQKMGIVKRFLDGDEEVLKRSSEVNPPEDYKKYFEIAALQRKKNDYINRGILGNNSSLHDVWIMEYTNSNMDGDLKNLEIEAQKKGAQNVISAMENHQKNHAINLPNNMQTIKQENSIEGISDDEVTKILGATTMELASSPELKEKKRLLMEKIFSG